MGPRIVRARPWFGGALCLALLAPQAKALDPRKSITHYSHSVWHTEDGLPQGSVRAIAQTRDGYLWLGTQAGLARFDGVRFTIFDRQNSPLQQDHVLSLRASRDGSLWIGANGPGGLYRWTVDGGIVNVLSGFRARALFEDPDGVLWVGTEEKGLLRLSGKNVRSFTKADGLGSDDIRAIVRDSAGTLWVGANGGGLSRYDAGKFIPYSTSPALEHEQIWALWADPDGTIWAGTKGDGLLRLKGGKVEKFTTSDGLADDVILSLVGDRNGSLWIGTDGGGLNRFDHGVFSSYTTHDGLSGDIVRACFEDREGILWLGTAGAGLDRLKDDPFNNYGHRDGLSSDLISSMLEDDRGAVWIGTTEGWLNRWDNGRISSYRLPGTTSRNTVGPLYQDDDGNIWAGLLPQGFRLIRSRGAKAQSPMEDVLIGRIRAVVSGPEKTVWIGTDSGLIKLSGHTRRTYTTDDGLPHNAVLSIAFDAHGAMWVGTRNGLAKRDGDRFRPIPADSHGPVDDAIISLYVDNTDVWLGTAANGFYRYRDGRFTHYTRKDGLPDGQIYSIMEDLRKNLWIACRKGILRLSIADIDAFDHHQLPRIPVVIYESLDGLRSSEINYSAKPPVLRTRDGRFWFATYGGVAVIDPEHLATNQTPPPVYIERIRSDHREISLGRAGVIEPSEGNLEIQYTAINFRAPQRVRFRYRLDGFDKDWIDADTRRIAYYTSLPYGSYRFRVIACNNDGVWNEQGASFDFVMRPHLYEMRWFWAVVIIVGIAGGAYILRARTRAGRVRESELAQRVAARTNELRREIEIRKEAQEAAAAGSLAKSEFLANMSHEIRTPMNGVMGMTQLALELANDPQQQEYLTMARDSAESLMVLLNDILDLSRIEAGKLIIDPFPFKPRQLIREAVQLLEVTARTKGLEVREECSPDVPEWIVADPLRLRQVLLNLLGNSIKFTDSGSVEVRMELTQARQKLRVAVSDTGIGIPLEKQQSIFSAFTQADGSITRKYGGAGLGLAISSRLLKLMGGDIRVDSEPGRGTTFEFEAPYSLPDREPEVVVPVQRCAAGLPVMHILLAEDNAVNQKLAVRLLQKHGHLVRVASNGRETVEAFERGSFDLILMDVQMPELNGWEATGMIRAREASSGGHVPIIAMTAHAMSGDRERCTAAGMDGYVSKPIDQAALMQEIEAVVGDRAGVR